MNNNINKIIFANWKMYGNSIKISEFIDYLKQNISLELLSHAVFMPPCIYLPLAQELCNNFPLVLGAQNAYMKDLGAYTGEISIPMLQEFACKYLLVGHSERRTLFHENEEMIAEKFHQAKVHGMIPVLCIGETLEERKKGATHSVLQQQLQILAHSQDLKNAIIAYEPIWAIGSGLTPTALEVQDIHSMIKAYIRESSKLQEVPVARVLYGGSVSAKNAADFLSMQDIDGLLVGAASRDAQSFLDIIKCIN